MDTNIDLLFISVWSSLKCKSTSKPWNCLKFDEIDEFGENVWGFVFQFVSNWVCLIELQEIWKRTDGGVAVFGGPKLVLFYRNRYFVQFKMWRCSRTLIFVYTQIVWNLVKWLLSLVWFFSLIEIIAELCVVDLVHYSKFTVRSKLLKCSLKRISDVTRIDQKHRENTSLRAPAAHGLSSY